MSLPSVTDALLAACQLSSLALPSLEPKTVVRDTGSLLTAACKCFSFSVPWLKDSDLARDAVTKFLPVISFSTKNLRCVEPGVRDGRLSLQLSVSSPFVAMIAIGLNSSLEIQILSQSDFRLCFQKLLGNRLQFRELWIFVNKNSVPGNRGGGNPTVSKR
jgi:hypothetical protein